MPRPIIFEGKELTQQEFATKLRELRGQKNYEQIVELTYQAKYNQFSAQDGDMSYIDVLEEFFKEVTSTIPDEQLSPEDLQKKQQLEADYKEKTKNTLSFKEIDPANHADVLGLLDAFTKKTQDAIIDAGRRRDAYQQQIREGKVPGTEIFKDSPRYVKRIAHDYVMLDDGVASDAMVDCFRVFSGQLYAKTININEAGVYVKETQDKYVANAVIENNVSKEFIEEYNDNYMERTFKMIEAAGYKYKKGPYSPNESRFETYAKHIQAVMDCNSEAKLDALEDKTQKDIEAYRNYERQIRSAAKISQTLYEQFKSIDWSDKEDINYTDCVFGFEHFTHLGTDYKYATPEIISEENRKVEEKTNKATADVPPIIVENAIANANRSLEDFFNQVANKIQKLEEEGKTDSPEYENANKMANILQSFNAVKNTAESLANGYKNEFHQNNTNITELEDTVDFIKTKRQQMKLTVLPEADDEYTRSIDIALNELSDSIVDCNLRPENTGNRYENVARSLMEHKRIYKKVIAAEQAGNDKLAEKYATQLEKNTAATKKLISNCKSYDKSTANEDGHTMGKAERRPLLTTLSTSIVNKTMEIKGRVFNQNYDKYIRLHTGKNAGKTVKERKQNLLKSIAASYLKKNGKEFSLKEIHKFAKSYDDKYCVLENSVYMRERGGNERLYNATQDATSVIRESNRLREDMYGIKNDQYNNYIKDMKTLANSMRSDKGRSTEYQNLVKAIKAASTLGEETANMSAKDKQEAFINANFNVIRAVKTYVKGKEKIRVQDKGNDAFNNSMDALAIISKYTKQQGLVANQAVAKLYGDILDRSNRTYLDVRNLEKNFGAKRAADAFKIRQEKENKKNKNKKPEEKKDSAIKK